MHACSQSRVNIRVIFIINVSTTPNQKKLGQYGKRFHCRQYEHKIFHVLSGQLHVFCKYTSFPVIQTCNTFQKKLGKGQFRASNEVNWLNNDVI